MTLKSHRTLAGIAFLALGCTTDLTRAQDSQGNQPMEHAQIQFTIDANNAAVAAGDVDAAVATFEESAAMAVQPGVSVAGTKALRESFSQFMALSPKLTVTKKEVIQAGNLALHSYAWTMSGKTPDGTPIQQAGLSVVVLRKQPDGRWLMVIDNPFADHLLQKK
jgi:uncharacterized protein (TIGR02246 family)